MAINYNPTAVTSGLICYLDGANTKSYSGSGTTVYDLSGNGRNGTFGGTVGPTWNSGGWFNFTGGVVATNYSRISLSVPTLANGVTVEIWFRSTYAYGTPFRMTSSDLGLTLFTPNASMYAGLNFNDYVLYFTNPVTDIWHCFSMTWDNQNLVVYKNGASLTSGTRATALTNIAAATLYLGTRNDAYNDHFFGDIAIFKLYERVLTASEVSKNFSSARGRFNL